MRNYNKQQGGTILGIIIGLIFGLGIALAVALVITKTPMPFTDKSGRQKAAELTAGQSADPNKPLYGKDVARESLAREIAPPINTAAPPLAETVPKAPILSQPGSPPGDNRAPVVERSAPADKLGMVESAPAPKSEKVEDKWIYFLQAGAFREQADAEGMRAKLALSGVEARISERQSESGVLYRVRVGPFPDLEAMNNVRGKLSDGGIDAAVVRAAK